MRPNYYKVTVWAKSKGARIEVELECFELIRALRFDFFLGNALKYLFRLGRKTENKPKDLKKTIVYCQQALDSE